MGVTSTCYTHVILLFSTPCGMVFLPISLCLPSTEQWPTMWLLIHNRTKHSQALWPPTSPHHYPPCCWASILSFCFARPCCDHGDCLERLLVSPCTTYLSAGGTGITSYPLCTTCTLCTCRGSSIADCTCTLHASTGVATYIAHIAYGSYTPLITPPAPSAPIVDPPSCTACAPYTPAPVPPLASSIQHMAPIPYTTPLTYPTVVPAPVPHTKPAPMPMVVLTAAPCSLHHVDLSVVDLAVVHSTSQPFVPFYRSGLAPHLTSLPMPKPFVLHAAPVTSHAFVPSTSALIPQVTPPSVFTPIGPPWSSSLASMPPVLFFTTGWADMLALLAFFLSALNRQQDEVDLPHYHSLPTFTVSSKVHSVEARDVRPSMAGSWARSLGTGPSSLALTHRADSWARPLGTGPNSLTPTYGPSPGPCYIYLPMASYLCSMSY